MFLVGLPVPNEAVVDVDDVVNKEGEYDREIVVDLKKGRMG